MSQPVLEQPVGTPSTGPAADPQSSNGKGVESSNSANNVTTTYIPTKVSGSSDPKMYTEEEINKAREQEKSKVYHRLETLQETVKRLEEEAQARRSAEEVKAQEAKQAADKKAEDEMSFKELLAKRDEEWQQRLQGVQQEVETEKALRERETQYAQLVDYRQQVVQQYSDRVAPQLLDLIQGDTPEEIAASAEDLAARSGEILAQTAEAMQNARRQTPTSRVTVPASGENSGSQRSYTPDEIRGMSMSDYAKHRRGLLGQGADGPRNRGLFG